MSYVKFPLLSVFILLLLSACITVNVHFPPAAVEQAADKLIKDVWEKKQAQEAQDKPPIAPPVEPQSQWSSPAPLLAKVLNVLIPAAQAAPNFNASTPAIEALKARMKQRFQVLESYYDKGAVGLTQQAGIALRDATLVPLRSRNKIKTAVADENQDREALYEAIAQANGAPKAVKEIRNIFAQRWISHAKTGWWYQNTLGQWKQK